MPSSHHPNPYSYLLRFRRRQFVRMAQFNGWLNVLFLLVMAIGVGIGAWPKLQKAVLLIPVLISWMIHSSRNDLPLLKRLFKKPGTYLLLEYAPLYVPVLIWYVYQLEPLWALGTVVAWAVTAFAGNGSNASGWSKWQQLNFSWLPQESFEPRALLRKNGLLVIAYWVLLTIAGINEYAWPTLFLMGFAFFPSVYQSMEGKELILYHPGRLARKWGYWTLAVQAYFLPGILLYAVMHPANVYLPLYAWAYISTLMAFVFVYKYHHYHPLRRAWSSDLPITIFMLLGLVLPVAWIWFFIIYKRYRNNPYLPHA